MKRLTDERIAALIDIAPLSKTIVDIKTALTELQERRKAVPDEMTVEAAYPEVQTGWNDAKNYVAGWNACRAAMLNGESK